MIYIVFQDDMTEDEVKEKYSDKKLIVYPDLEFETLQRRHDLNKDRFFIDCLRKIDECDVPMDNVARDLRTGRTHSFDKISTGVRVMWLMKYYADRFIFPSCYFGQNCYQTVFDLGKTTDIVIYDDAEIFTTDEIDYCTGEFTNAVTGQCVNISDGKGWEYFIRRGSED